MPLESRLLSTPTRREFLQFSLASLAVADSACAFGPRYNYHEGFLGDARFNTGGELERLVVMNSDEGDMPRDRVDKLVLTSRQAFMNLPVSEWQDMLPEGKVTFLYPAAGVHIMPLQLGYRIMQQFPKVNEAEFIYTEVNPRTETGFMQQLSILEKLGLVKNINSRTQYYPNNNSEPNQPLGNIPHETTYSFNAIDPGGKPHKITVVYALNMSGEDPFRKEYAERSSILISHDSYPDASKDMVNMALKINGRYKGKHDVILLAEPDFVLGGFFQDIFDSISTRHWSSANTRIERDFPNQTKLIQGGYGCPNPFPFSSMLMMYLNKKFVNSELGQRSLLKYFG